MSDELENLLRSSPFLWRGRELQASEIQSIPSGYAELDRLLPGQGWPRGAVIEILLESIGIGELRLMLPAIRRLIAEQRLIVMIDTPYQPYAPALVAWGLDLKAFYLIQPERPEDGWWAAEKALLNPACGMVLLWSGGLRGQQRNGLKEPMIRRLQVAAQSSQAILLLYRIGSQNPNPPSSWAALRMRLAGQDGVLRIELLKARGSLEQSQLLLNLDNLA